MKVFIVLVCVICVSSTLAGQVELEQEAAATTQNENQIQVPLFPTDHVLRRYKRLDGAGESAQGVKRVLRRRVKKAYPVARLRKVLKKRRPVAIQEVPSVNKTGSSEDDSRLSQSDRNGRFFSLFTVVRFNNDACPTSSGDNGTCYTSSDCSGRGGSADGTCASGFGVCCYFKFQCGATTSENGTYFTNPSTTQRICNLMINRLNDDICQIKLEFDSFDIADPNLNGECETDFFLVTGGSPVPQLCGANTGAHVRYSITSNSGPTQLSMVMDTTVTTTASRLWNMRIYQYECSSRMLAPVGCLQYYSGASGIIQSFNYKSEVRGANEPNHLANLNYAICVRVENGYCGIRYSQVSTDPFSFTLSGDSSPAQTFPLPATKVSFGDQACNADFVFIAGGSEDGETGKLTRDRYCGQALGTCEAGKTTCIAISGPVTTYVKPFTVNVVSDSDETTISTDTANRGFRLTFNQQPCLSG